MIQQDEKFLKSAQLLRSFAGIHRNMIRYVQKTAADHGLSMPQYTILMALARTAEMTQKKIGKKTMLPKSTLSQAVDGLVRDGLIDREQVEGNRRETLLSLSPLGAELIEKIHQHEGGVHQVFQEVTESLTDEQYEKLLEVHQQINEKLTNTRQEERHKC
ncbi:DNA-binding transcriptional repressor MarR [Planococcus massiliensis]|uniref:DNA-binding transcriptional repressor MarR n=1 Tax=Planococcus massiliensis TaxID=1499687 RepID=A0A098ERF6_9BACL|nr:MarR family transcriptional regulator [Planococcus massiliensis]CEG23881.1 DNA-binding transcriptional repressor MarR [Planococcus massiliensis]